MAINVLTPIETKYKGILFRSRIEARWALFFDKIKVPYEYEREGYKLDDSTWYLPDFWMPQQDFFIEIKGAAPNLEEEIKASVLAQQSGKSVFIFHGGIPTIEQYGSINFDPSAAAWRYSPDTTMSDGWIWAFYEGRPHLVKWADSREDNPLALYFLRHFNPVTDPLVYAYNAARSARF